MMIPSLHSSTSISSEKPNSPDADNIEHSSSNPQPHFTITFAVAPFQPPGFVTSLISTQGPPPPFATVEELRLIEESATFDVEANKIPLAMRCTCLLAGKISCTPAKAKEHWLVEWEEGSLLEIIEDEQGNPIGKKKGKPRKYTGWCKADMWAQISDTESICCIEGLLD